MKFDFNITVDFDNIDPDLLGELLRGQFFNQVIDKNKYRTLGCYDTFELNEDIRKLDNIKIDSLTITCAEKFFEEWGTVKMCYYWDGDGELVFFFPFPNKYLINDDCKKTYGWKLKDGYFKDYLKSFDNIHDF